ncbi:phage baseplate protein, partial [Pseudomonas aeruginosa]|nr:phage baseplate protein [Pseudomonas aeruginosa]
MIGMDRRSGLPLSGLAHLKQSVEDNLTTPLGSRRMRPEYGSKL